MLWIELTVSKLFGAGSGVLSLGDLSDVVERCPELTRGRIRAVLGSVEQLPNAV